MRGAARHARAAGLIFLLLAALVAHGSAQDASVSDDAGEDGPPDRTEDEAGDDIPPDVDDEAAASKEDVRRGPAGADEDEEEDMDPMAAGRKVGEDGNDDGGPSEPPVDLGQRPAPPSQGSPANDGGEAPVEEDDRDDAVADVDEADAIEREMTDDVARENQRLRKEEEMAEKKADLAEAQAAESQQLAMSKEEEAKRAMQVAVDRMNHAKAALQAASQAQEMKDKLGAEENNLKSVIVKSPGGLEKQEAIKLATELESERRKQQARAVAAAAAAQEDVDIAKGAEQAALEANRQKWRAAKMEEAAEHARDEALAQASELHKEHEALEQMARQDRAWEQQEQGSGGVGAGDDDRALERELDAAKAALDQEDDDDDMAKQERALRARAAMEEEHQRHKEQNEGGGLAVPAAPVDAEAGASDDKAEEYDTGNDKDQGPTELTSCPRFNGVECGGPARGRCDSLTGTCNCEDGVGAAGGFFGDSCQCGFSRENCYGTCHWCEATGQCVLSIDECTKQKSKFDDPDDDSKSDADVNNKDENHRNENMNIIGAQPNAGLGGGGGLGGGMGLSGGNNDNDILNDEDNINDDPEGKLRRNVRPLDMDDFDLARFDRETGGESRPRRPRETGYRNVFLGLVVIVCCVLLYAMMFRRGSKKRERKGVDLSELEGGVSARSVSARAKQMTRRGGAQAEV